MRKYDLTLSRHHSFYPQNTPARSGRHQEGRAELASSQMATCSDGDSFYLDCEWTWNDLDTVDGCYMDSGYTNNDLPEYFPAGEKVEGPGVHASDYWGVPVSSSIGRYHPRHVVVGVFSDYWGSPVTSGHQKCLTLLL